MNGDFGFGGSKLSARGLTSWKHAGSLASRHAKVMFLTTTYIDSIQGLYEGLWRPKIPED